MHIPIIAYKLSLIELNSESKRAYIKVGAAITTLEGKLLDLY